LDNPKKILILYASAGHGHEKAAEALLDACKESKKAVRAETIDTLLLAKPLFFGKLYRQFYYILIKHAPWLWGFFYNSLDRPWIYFFARPVRRVVNALTARPLERLIERENPAVILATHFLSVEVASFLRRKKRINSKIITVVTDYLPHHIWTASEVDYYVVALEETKTQLARRGVAPEKIEVLGIPIEKKFLTKRSKEEVRGHLGLQKGPFTVLVTSGGAGVGLIHDIADDLLKTGKDVQILTVCGTNKRLFAELERKSKLNPLLKVFGFVANMDELMEAADVVIGKAGGLTITESFVKGKPVILYHSVPGQETRNAVCVMERQAGFVTSSADAVAAKVSEWIDFPDRLNAVKENVTKIAKPFAAKNIVHLAEDAL